MKQSSTLFRAAHLRIFGPLCADRLSKIKSIRAVRTGGADRLERREGVRGALAAPVDAPELVVADGVAAVELPDSVELVVVRRQPVRVPGRRPPGAGLGTDHRGPNSSKANTRCGNWVLTYSIRASLASRCGSVDPFHLLVRWKVIRCRCRICRSRSRPTRTRRVASTRR